MLLTTNYSLVKILALDIGTKRTGVAYTDETLGFPIALETIHHRSKKEFLEAVLEIVRAKKIEHVVVGIPYLPSGEEGSQAAIVREYAALLEAKNIPLSTVDERYSTGRKVAPRAGVPGSGNPDSEAAIAILDTFLSY
ncbi:Holliday junction resolvase RuvX [Candidatus Peregrinibacteria bacterium]|nr:Holliday junction resolvase RuvX [Candidatus Peregrinibacteria bacterium]